MRGYLVGLRFCDLTSGGLKACAPGEVSRSNAALGSVPCGRLPNWEPILRHPGALGPALCDQLRPSWAEPLPVFGRGDERFHHFGLSEVAVGLVQLVQPETVARVVRIGRIGRI